MKLASIFLAGAAKTTTGVIVTVATAATVVTTASVVRSPSLPVEQVQSAASAYIETLPEVSSGNEAQDLIENTDRLEVQEPDDMEEPEQTPSQPAPKPQTQTPQVSAAAPAPVAQTDPVAPVQPAPTTPIEENNSTPPEETSEKINQTVAEDVAQAPAAIPQPKADPVQPVQKPQVQEPQVQEPVSAPVQAEPESEPEKAPAYEFTYDRTTKIYENDGKTLIRVEYYDENNKLTHYSSVVDHDPETNSYTENIYTYDEETQTQILQRTDVYEGSETEKAQ